jgi:hypothetical protein
MAFYDWQVGLKIRRLMQHPLCMTLKSKRGSICLIRATSIFPAQAKETGLLKPTGNPSMPMDFERGFCAMSP